MAQTWQKVEEIMMQPISCVVNARKGTNIGEFLVVAMQILHTWYAVNGYPNRANSVIKSATPKSQEQQ